MVYLLCMGAIMGKNPKTVTQIASFVEFPFTVKFVTLKSTPMVAAWSGSKLSSVNRSSKLKQKWLPNQVYFCQFSRSNISNLDFPTPLSPIIKSFKVVMGVSDDSIEVSERIFSLSTLQRQHTLHS